MRSKSQGHSLTLTQDSHSMTVSSISSEATGPTVAKFYIQSSGAVGAKILKILLQKFINTVK